MAVFVPRPYQGPIIERIIDNAPIPRSNVWADMGMGKTVSALVAIDTLLALGEARRVLVLAPRRVAQSVWPREAKKWDNLKHLRVVAAVGSAAERAAALRVDAPIHATNYDNLPWLCEHYGDRWPFDMVVADESTRVKNLRLSVRTSSTGKEFIAGAGGIRSRAIGKIAHTRIKRWANLTGTPSPNGLIDLWGQAWFLDAGQRLGRTFEEGFKHRWFKPNPDGYGSVPLPFAMEQIQDRLRDVTISLKAEDWFDLREPVVNNVYVDLPARVRAQYRDMERKMFALIEADPVEALHAGARTQKLLQFACGAVYLSEVEGQAPRPTKEWREVHDMKLQALQSIVAEAAGEPIIVVYEFRPDKERILKAFRGARTLDGPGAEDDWNAGKIPMLVIHPASAGHGLNLQDGGRRIVNFGHNWNLELRQQVAERLGPVRQMQSGYDRAVYHTNIIARDTVEELVLERVQSKADVQDILRAGMARRRAGKSLGEE
jgi:hypothetical protein